MASDERTEQIDIETLRKSLAEAQGAAGSRDAGAPRAGAEAPATPDTIELELESEDMIEDVADVEDVEDVDEPEELEPLELFDAPPPTAGQLPVGSMSLSVPVVFDEPSVPNLASVEVDISNIAGTASHRAASFAVTSEDAPPVFSDAPLPAFPDPEDLPEPSLPSFPLSIVTDATAEDLPVPDRPSRPLPNAITPLDPTPIVASVTDATPVVPASTFEIRAYEAGVTDAVDIALTDELDAEEQEHFDSGAFASLAALYKQRLAEGSHPRQVVTHLVRLAEVYETKLGDPNAAFETLVSAFELAPDSPRVVAAIDRVGRATERIGELAEKVRRELLPKSPDDRRVVLLTHIVYWYERVLGRGREVAGFVAEIGRYDKNHPILLKRAAQLAELNGDVKGQRDLLVRALERTTRNDERLALLLALARAHAGTADELRYYEGAVELDPTSIVALQGFTRVAREKDRFDLVRWGLQRQSEVAEGTSERVVALVELAALEETKFLKRDIAASLFERVLAVEPSHPQALQGLERCYRALREWTKLIDVIGRRIEHATDDKTKIELFEVAAEVHESKLGDLSAAARTYQSLLGVEPRHRRALADLARIYEKLGDWTNFAQYKAAVAELAPTPRAASTELVKLGEFLSAPDRNPAAAKQQYERATEIDPSNAAAWSALQKLAAVSGDVLRIVDFLEERAKHTEIPRQRANVFAEIGKVHRERGDEHRAREAYEQAIAADPSNEPAAAAMLDVYIEQNRWPEAAPLCELLVNAAIRDRDTDALFVRLRLVTKIAAALGDADRAISAAVVALEARPEDEAARTDLIMVASAFAGAASLERARPHLLRIAEEHASLPAEPLRRLASVQRSFGDVDGATLTLERVRRLEPDDAETSAALADIYLGRGDFARACKLKVDLARNAPNAEARFTMLYEAGEIWARRAEELEMAAAVFAEAREIKPFDPALLQTLMWLYGELDQWDQLSAVLEDLSKVQETVADKLETLLAMARVSRDKLGDRLRAADIYDQILDRDRKRLDVFEELARTLTEEKAWERLELAYRRMIERVRDDNDARLSFLLYHQLGLVYRDRLGDAPQAFDALEEAGRLDPDHAEVRRSLTELLVVTDNLDNAVVRIREHIHRTPYEAPLYQELYELFLRQHSFDKAWCAVDVYARLGKLDAEQRRFHEDYAPMPLDRVPGQVVEQAWRSHLQDELLDPKLTAIFALVAQPYARLRTNQVRPDQRVTRPFTPNHSRLYDAVRRTFDDASEILAAPSPELLLAETKTKAPFVASFIQTKAVLVSTAAVEGRSHTLAYLVGKTLAELRRELLIRSFVPSVTDLTALLHTAVRVSRNEPADEAGGTSLDQSFSAALSVQEAAALRSSIAHASSDSAFDVEAWARSADLSSMRAGLLVAGTVEQAAQAIMAETSSSGSMTPHEKLGELYKFATSDLYADLRGAIGVAVQG